MFFYFHESDIFPYDPISPVWMIFFSGLSFLFFYYAGGIVKSSSKEKQGQPHSTWLQHNTSISFIHSFISSVLIIIGVLRAPEMLDDPLSHINLFNYGLLAFSLGYFLWDFYECLMNSDSSVFPILFHHLFVIAFLMQVLLRTRNLGYAIHGLSLEINSVFLHGRRLLRWYLPIHSGTRLRLFVDAGNYVTFILFRFGIVIHGLYMLYIQRYRLDPIVHVFTVLCVASIGVLNTVLFYRLAKNQFLGKRSNKKYFKNDENILITDNHILLPS